MKLAELCREIVYPLTDMGIIFAMLFFWLTFTLIDLAGFLGIWLCVLVAPAYFRYLLYLLEARANGKHAPVPTAEMFSPAENLWTLTPLILVALLTWCVILLSGSAQAWLTVPFGFLVLLITPASMGILAITHSPEESLNPAALFKMIRVCGYAYLVVPLVIILITFASFGLAMVGLPLTLLELTSGYQAVLLFTLTGAVLRANEVAFDVAIDAPLETTEQQVAVDLEQARHNVASHAYGFISRGNRAGGFAHISDWIQQEDEIEAASAWFFGEMMTWESKDAALYFAQTYLAHLLHHELDIPALKLISTCLHVNSNWQPRVEDRPYAIELAEKFGRSDLLQFLRT